MINGHEINASFSAIPMPETFYRIREILLNTAFGVADAEDSEYNRGVHLDNSTTPIKIPLSDDERSINHD